MVERRAKLRQPWAETLASLVVPNFGLFDVCATVHHQYNDVNNQQNATTFSFINLFKSAQHVSGDKFAHPQEHFLTVRTAFGTMHCNDKL